MNKVDRVMQLLISNDIDFAAICETWITDSNCPVTATIKSYGYSLIHNIRSSKRGGGTAILFKKGLSMTPFRLTLNFTSFEYTCAIAKSVNGTAVAFLVVYRPGNFSSAFLDQMDKLLAAVFQKCDALVLSGDLNIHFEVPRDRNAKQAIDLFQSFGLERKVFGSTHIAGGSLDQIFIHSKFNQLSCDVSVDQNPCLLGSDHYPVFAKLGLTYERKYFKNIVYRDMKKINNDLFREQLQQITTSLDFSSIGTAVKALKEGCSRILDAHCPVIKKSVSVVDDAPWFDSEYRDLRKLRRKSERIARKPSATPLDWLHYREMSDKCTDLARAKKKCYFTKKIDSAGGNARALYSTVNKALDRKQDAALPDYTDDIKVMAHDFNCFFNSKIEKIRSSMDPVDPPVVGTATSSQLLYEFEPSNSDEITEIIKEFGVKCAPEDMLPLKLLRENMDVLLPCLVKLVNTSLSDGYFDGLKTADIIPLLKNESLDPNVLKNFRPISNLLFLGKLIERVVHRRLDSHMAAHGLHMKEQSAYKKCHSTETLLVRVWNDLLVAADERTATVVMMLDLSAAFDTVDHNLLLRILKNEIGIRGKVLLWFESFLKGRVQRIRLGETTSEFITIKFGVPQGSVLGPVLFNIYIRSIYKHIQALKFMIHGYADDHQILKSFKPSAQGVLLTDELNNCFLETKRWMNRFYLQMNDLKTQIIVFGSSKVLNQIQISGVNFDNGTSVRFINTVKNLGFHMDSSLTLQPQMVELKKKCFRMLRNICKIRYLLNEDQLKKVVNSLVVSCLDYCNGLYYGATDRVLGQLQLIQNACAKAITGKYKYDHLDGDLSKLHWLNIRKRIVFKICLLSYKAINGLAPVYLQELFSYSHHGHSPKLIIPCYNLERYGKRAFGNIGPRVMNRLPSKITEAVSVGAFKCSLKTYLFTLHDEELRKLCD